MEAVGVRRRWRAGQGLTGYMGARLEELGQALVSGVVTVGGVLSLDINDQSDGKSVKTTFSRRTVPIHPELLRLGFNRYVATLDKSGRLTASVRLVGGTMVAFSFWGSVEL